MDRIPEDKILKYNPDTLLCLRKAYNLDKPGQMDEAIDLLDAWIKKQNHLLKKDFSREYLERVIILLKGSVERAKGQIEKICTLRTLLPEFFANIDPKNDFKDIKKYTYSTLLPRLTQEHHRIHIMSFEPEQFSSKIIKNIYFYNILICEYLKAHDYSDGLINVIDFRKIKSMIELAAQFNLLEMKQMATIVLKGYCTRCKKFVLISESNAIDIMVKLLKQVITEKLRQRVFVARDLEDLHKHVQKELLPSDYGGDDKPLSVLFDQFHEVLSSKENMELLKEMSEARTDEAMRSTTKINEDFLGIEGSFRNLTFD